MGDVCSSSRPSPFAATKPRSLKWAVQDKPLAYRKKHDASMFFKSHPLKFSTFVGTQYINLVIKCLWFLNKSPCCGTFFGKGDSRPRPVRCTQGHPRGWCFHNLL